MLSSDDVWLLTVLNSPLLWSYMWRNVIHGKDEVLKLKSIYTEKLPIAPPTDEARAEAEGAVGRLVEITHSGQEAWRDLLDWLHVEFGIEKLGQKLDNFAALDADAFVKEVQQAPPQRRKPPLARRAPGAAFGLR